jgi:fatty-acyl-CoA synthase
VETLIDFIRLNARRNPDRVAVVDENGRLTHAELAERAWALARGLAEIGVRPGDRVGVLAGNSNFAVETLLGTVAAGAVWVPFNWRWAREELVHGINLTRPKVVLVEDQFVSAFDAAEGSGDMDAADLKVRRQGQDYESFLIPGGPLDIRMGPEDPLCILFTGGTTGTSKGVVLPQRSAIFNAVNEIADLGFGQYPYNTAINVTPLFHSAALLCVLIPNYITGGTNVLLHKFDEDTFGDLVEAEQVNSTFIIPNMIRRLLKAGFFDRTGLECFRQLHSGGGLLRMPDKEAVLAKMPHLELFFRYGLTEGGPMVARLRHEDILRSELDGSIGQEYTFCEVQLQDADGAEVPPGELGEICVRGPSVMLGYFDRPEESATTLRGGWLHTGDLAVRDEDGYLFFRDRAKDMIKSGGENVYAAEIEQLLYAYPAIMECGVLGVTSDEWDEEVRAVVALRPGGSVTEDELRDYLREHLAGYKIPKKFLFLEPGQMPVNPSGKIVKSRLREITGW